MFEITATTAFIIYFIFGLIAMHDLVRIRFYALVTLWFGVGHYDSNFVLETFLLAVTFFFAEKIFAMYQKAFIPSSRRT